MEVGGVKVIDPAELAKTSSPSELLKLTIDYFTVQKKIFAGVKTVGDSDAVIGQRLRLGKRTLEVAITVLHEKLSDDASLTATLKQTYADAIAAMVPVFAATLKKTPHDVLQAHRADIHEWGWPRDQAEATADTASDAIPAADRKRIKVQSTQTVPTAQLDLRSLFATTGGTVTIGLPAGTDVAFSGVDAKLERGLRNVAGMLTSRMTPPPLVLDSTISLALDLASYGGDYALYRFTYFTQHAKGKPAAKRVLIERRGALGMEGLPPSQQDEAQQRFTKHGFTFAGTWDAGEKQTVLRAIALVPEGQLAMVAGIAFRREGTHKVTPDAAGNYSPDKHVITLFDKAFKESSARLGSPGQQVVGGDVFDVVHEIGHAIDYRAYRAGNKKADDAKKALLAEFGAYETPPGSLNFEKVPGQLVPRLNTLLRAQKKSQDEADAPKTESGHVLKGGVLTTDPAAKTAFRDAVAKDGGARPTPYSDDTWEEAFAESYALYVTEPDALRRLRPSVHAFLAKRFPR
jgi:hypothetical protein